MRRSARKRRPPGAWWKEARSRADDLEPRRLSSELFSSVASPAGLDETSVPRHAPPTHTSEHARQRENILAPLAPLQLDEVEEQEPFDDLSSPVTPAAPRMTEAEVPNVRGLSPSSSQSQNPDVGGIAEEEVGVENSAERDENPHSKLSIEMAGKRAPTLPSRKGTCSSLERESWKVDWFSAVPSVETRDGIARLRSETVEEGVHAHVPSSQIRDSRPMRVSGGARSEGTRPYANGSSSWGCEEEEKFLITKRSQLKFVSVETPTGFVKIAIGLFANSVCAGELRVEPRMSSGVRRALRGDEFYCISHGILQLEIGWRRFMLAEGDFFAVMRHTSFEILNPGTELLRIVWLSLTDD